MPRQVGGLVSRYIVYGAGAVAGRIGTGLFEAGYETLLIARGPHYEAIAHDGLRVDTPLGSNHYRVPVVDHPLMIDFREEDIILLGMKTQDTLDALLTLRPLVSDNTVICCVQNAVENERLALRFFDDVYGVLVFAPATHVSPGIIFASSSPIPGVLDIGRYPGGSDGRAEEIAEALTKAGYSSRAVPDIMSWKYAKLLGNLGNAVEVVLGPDTSNSEVRRRARAEGVETLRAANIDVTSDEEFRKRTDGVVTVKPVPGLERHTTSSWQSVIRGSTTVESDYLNGEIAMLGREFSVATPVNVALQRLANEVARGAIAPGSMNDTDVLVAAGVNR
jgi:2-dehydropantoate 2-reductase